jgi:hypothetical protein
VNGGTQQRRTRNRAAHKGDSITNLEFKKKDRRRTREGFWENERKTQKDTERHKKTQKDTKRHRKTQKDKERQRKTQKKKDTRRI